MGTRATASSPGRSGACAAGTGAANVAATMESAQECIALSADTAERLGAECEARGGTYGNICNCRCTELLDCKEGCVEDGIESRCTDLPHRYCSGRRRARWSQQCYCTEVTRYFTSYADNVTLMDQEGKNSAIRLASPLSRLFLALLSGLTIALTRA
eukprot:CAMPEP_0178378342 /NCGR_PEP_ID=MMETSP0689_2-20121128/4378_1 /TAXON_ID=160604 /ORGANISM="Amphidinium massartii, Strain CS-259" /LENGTH=156 /DNA_ID=CAMNT_0019998411 /DNA_START=144 /DNA_END=613 /DNA_ORIENTATION=-